MRAGVAWTDEQKKAASERMRLKWVARKAEQQTLEALPEAPRERSPEVQAVIDSMDPARKARLEMVQSRQWSRDAASDRATQDALERHEAQKTLDGTQMVQPMATGIPVTPGAIGQVSVPPRPGSREVNLIVKNDGTMVSMHGPCVCGAAKRLWHSLCLKGS